MKIIPITENNLDAVNKLKAIGVCTRDLDNIYGLYVNNNLVGFSQHLKIFQYLEIDNLHILKDFRYKGYGKTFITCLRDKYKGKVSFISGQSKPSAVEFWSKMNARFEDEINEEEIANAELEGYCFPFTIKVKDDTTRMDLL